MHIRSLVLGAVVALGLGGAAFAADLRPVTVTPVTVETIDLATNFYVGGNVGVVGVANGADQIYSVGVVAGADLTENFGVEVAYDRSFDKLETGAATSDLLTANLIARIDTGIIEPYVLGGVGYKWTSAGTNGAVYNVGAGARVAVTETIDLDARYRYINSFDNQFNQGGEHRATVGVLFKF